ncbi:unnamed protein product [Vitrella brassicaformis CCMP3155]|uniref:choline-phosphate cytidylyltransferase n=3 Tax=Vitrella brassicaformis TaxID=1169539 RepID=A0A0G4EZV0_VITBC|nr:unnamed protein product [Vitrella brassicaformis CCMP3155]|eukprot:CEM05155.1 unnamed protein product [Vitrella brassicaformis CCMP3155]
MAASASAGGVDVDETVAKRYRRDVPDGMSSLQPVHLYMDGVFDFVHAGDMEAFQRAREEYGYAHLTVGVTSDAETEAFTGAPPVLSRQQRADALRQIKGVDKVVCCPWIITPEFLRKHGIHYVCLAPSSSTLYRYGTDLPRDEVDMIRQHLQGGGWVRHSSSTLYRYGTDLPRDEVDMIRQHLQGGGWVRHLPPTPHSYLSSANLIAKIIRHRSHFIANALAEGSRPSDLAVSSLLASRVRLSCAVHTMARRFMDGLEGLTKTALPVGCRFDQGVDAICDTIAAKMSSSRGRPPAPLAAEDQPPKPIPPSPNTPDIAAAAYERRGSRSVAAGAPAAAAAAGAGVVPRHGVSSDDDMFAAPSAEEEAAMRGVKRSRAAMREEQVEELR